MGATVVFSSLLAQSKGDPCHFRLEVTSGNGTKFIHDFLINAAGGCARDKAKQFGLGLQKFLESLEWGHDPKEVFDRDVIYALTSMEGVLSSGSAMVVQDRARGLGVTYTSIKVAGERDCERLMKELKRLSKMPSIRRR